MHLDDLPPIAVPLRFHLTTPVFGVLAGIVLLADGWPAWTSRWNGALLAATHLLTLGVLAMAMVGSLFQVVPVLAGRALPRWTAPAVHLLLALGTLALAAALWRPAPGLWAPAIGLLAAAFALFVLVLATRVGRAAGDSMFAVKLAAVSLLVTIGLGVFLAVCRGWPELAVDGFRTWTDVHAAWGLGGWVALLVMGVSFQVIPMFQVAPAFDSRLARGAAVAVFAGLVLVSHARSPWLVVPCAAAIAGGLVTYAVHTLAVIARRTRKRADALLGFWRLALASLIAAALLGFATACGADLTHVAGAVAIAGFASTVVIGMQLKIAAFLSFVHLQRRCLTSPAAARELPLMDAFVSPRAAWWQLGVHALAVVAIVVAIAGAWRLGPVAAVLVITDFALLGRNLATAAWRYRCAGRRIAVLASAA